MSDTPRTDAAVLNPHKTPGAVFDYDKLVPADFARELEHEIIRLKIANNALRYIIKEDIIKQGSHNQKQDER